MINAIAELGEFGSESSDSKLDIWLEDSYHKKNYPHLLLIEFKKVQGKWSFSGINYQEHSSGLKGKLLYKRGSSRGADKTPTCKVAKSIESTFQQKIVSWFKKNTDKEFLQKHEKIFLKEIATIISENSQIIQDKLVAQQKLLGKDGIVVSCVFEENENRLFIGDKSFFQLFITEESKLDYMYSKTFKKSSYSQDQICSICQTEQKEVYGYFTSLKFYTVDKPGMVSGGFQQDQSWKNYPVCLNCALNIEQGIQITESKLDFNFYGLKYYLIPKLLFPRDQKDILQDLLNIEMLQNPKINNKLQARITNDENEIFDYVQDYDNQIVLNIVFYEKPQKVVFRILANIEDLLPSTIKKLFDAKKVVDETFAIEQKDNKPLFHFNFGFLRTFFPNNKIEGNFNKAFLEIVQKIFTGSHISYSYLIEHYMKHIRREFIKDDFFWYDTIKGFILLNFLQQLRLLDQSAMEDEMDTQFFATFSIDSKHEFEEKVELFFAQFAAFFVENPHKAIFLLGVLTQFLLNIQQRERQSTPFRSRLKGLKMDSRDIATLLPRIIEKLQQYKANYYSALAELTSKYLISAGYYRNWGIAVDEMNYIFALGMNLSKYFKIQSDKKEKENE